MSIATRWKIESNDSEETFAIGEQLGKACKGGEVIVLSSDLGGGKTTFTKGIAKGLGSTETIGSPTYTVRRVYKCRGDIYLHHFDFYRLQEPGIIAHELSEIVDSPHSVVVIEWGDIVQEILPQRRVVVHFSHVGDNEEARILEFDCPPELSYLRADRPKKKNRKK
jgi:tRNA threonylcarbamoyladenosine biosynthesis protein TsaE